LVQVAIDCEKFGAEGVTVHPRPDQRHIRYDDIPKLKDVVQTEFNIEGNPIPKFMELVLQNRPHQCTLVPDKPNALTSSAGWDTVENEAFLTDITKQLQAAGIRVSIFVNADKKMVEGAKKVGADRIEFYTGDFARAFHTEKRAEVMAKHTACSQLAHEIGLEINAGHDLDLKNLKYYKNNMPYLHEVSIGHALISDALYFGLQNTIQMYLRELNV
jgi:pyridoxine 5-phosphate synthase